jgi:glutathione S-transferase
MALTLYYGSGSPYAWRVQLALEHKALPYELKVLSFSAGDTRKPEFLALNPRHQVPVLVDGDFTLYESNAIVEYIDEAYPGRGTPLFPGDAKARAIIRRMILEVDNYYSVASDKLLDQAFWKKPEERDAKVIAESRKEVVGELGKFASAMRGDYLVGPLVGGGFCVLCDGRVSKTRADQLPDLVPTVCSAGVAAWKARSKPAFSTRPFRRIGRIVARSADGRVTSAVRGTHHAVNDHRFADGQRIPATSHSASRRRRMSSYRRISTPILRGATCRRKQNRW